MIQVIRWRNRFWTGWFIFLFTVWGLPLSATAQQALSLKQAIARALERNEDVLMAKTDYEAARAKVREAVADALPNISADALYIRNIQRPVFFFPNPLTGEQTAFRVGNINVFSATINLQQPLYQAGKIGRALKVARLFRQFSEEGFRATRDNIILATIDAYFQVLLAKKLVDVNRQTYEQALEHLRNARLLYQQGQVSEFDTLRAYVETVNLQPLVLSAENRYQIALNNLTDIIDFPQDQAFLLTDSLHYQPEPLPTLEEAVAIAMQRRPELNQFALEAEMRKQNIGIVRANILPKLYLNSSWQTQAQSDRFDPGPQGFKNSLSASIQLSLPIFDGMRTYAQIDQARAEYRKAVYNLEKLKEQIRLQIKSLLFSLREAEKSIEAQQQNMVQARRAVELANLRYREGQSTYLDLGDARVALNQAQSNFYQFVYEHHVLKAQLFRAMGILSQKFDLSQSSGIN